MSRLNLLSVLWKEGDENGQDAVASVEDGVVVFLKFPDGYEVRLLWHELEALFDFAIDEIDRQGGFDEPLTRIPDRDEIPF